MMNKVTRGAKIRSIFKLMQSGTINYRRSAKALKISRDTLKKYEADLRNLIILYPDKLEDVSFYINRLRKPAYVSDKCISVNQLFPQLAAKIKNEHSTRYLEWEKYKKNNPDGLQLSQFNIYFSKWYKSTGTKRPGRSKALEIPAADVLIFKQWKKGPDKLKWDWAACMLGRMEGKSLKEIGRQIERSPDTLYRWVQKYARNGIGGLLRKPIKQNEMVVQAMEIRKANLMKLLHETPALHGINRTSWSLQSLSEAYEKKYQSYICTSSISEYIIMAGYSFKKARETLTSPDPLFREKLNHITAILSNLQPNERFFSVDEFGPFAVKIKGGRSYSIKGETKSYPQLQKSKGCIICTAALELSTNQITHFYSKKKNTDEMIKLLEVLLVEYMGMDKIYFLWDAASWHASKKLYKKIETVNDAAYRKRNNTPAVELAPLPSSAQFLNVIESVFSGLARAILHNSDYPSADACKEAIDLYFTDRNQHFKKFPHKAGDKIWGKELIIPVFDQTKNCKDPKWR